jgi:hypothetical protein
MAAPVFGWLPDSKARKYFLTSSNITNGEKITNNKHLGYCCRGASKDFHRQSEEEHFAQELCRTATAPARRKALKVQKDDENDEKYEVKKKKKIKEKRECIYIVNKCMNIFFFVSFIFSELVNCVFLPQCWLLKGDHLPNVTRLFTFLPSPPSQLLLPTFLTNPFVELLLYIK